MCGFAGVLQQKEWPGEPLAILGAMASAMRHRGPDDEGLWVDQKAGIGLAFRRLAILDLTQEGHQPMFSVEGRYVIVFNGEVYNHSVLRQELESLGHRFRGHSDTEVMLAAFTQWGVAVVRRFWGMFAIALWDRRERVLHLMRDRVGKKPVYWGIQGGVLLFGSELKALRAHPAFQGEVDLESLDLYLQHDYIPTPRTIYRCFQKLRPGHVLSIRAEALDRIPASIPFWDLVKVAQDGERHPAFSDPTEAEEALHDLLMDAVRIRMVADVSVGAFLSGGIDSSTVAALMQAQSARKVRTFTIGFQEDAYSESNFARSVAAHLGTDHTELFLSPEDALGVIPMLPRIFDEPFADSSQIPTFLISKLARGQVTVALSGDGGDELFGGYSRYVQGRKLWGTVSNIPGPIRSLVRRAILGLSPTTWDHLLKAIRPALRGAGGDLLTGDRFHKLAELLQAKDLDALYLLAITRWSHNSQVLKKEAVPPRSFFTDQTIPDLQNPIHRMMYLDLVTYLVDDILVKVDRATMAVSLEARAPLLDHRVAEFAWLLPMDFKLRSGKGKWLLRKVLDRYVPRKLVERPKQGFGVPIVDWLRGPLRPWAEELLDPARLLREGLFHPKPILHKWHEHLSGRRDWQYHLWNILMFQAWLDQQRH